MIRKIIFRPEAVEDVGAAAAWYDKRSPGLGDALIHEVLGATDRAALTLVVALAQGSRTDGEPLPGTIEREQVAGGRKRGQNSARRVADPFWLSVD